MSEAYKQLLKNPDAASPLQDKINRAMAENSELKQKEFAVHKAKVESQFHDLEERRLKQEIAKNIQVDIIAPDFYTNLVKENTEYFQLAKTAPIFINEDFEQAVPYFARNLIFIGAESGNGKSTTAGNLAYHTILQGKKTLIITNEEINSDVYNRVTCLIKDWGYTNHKKFSDQQVETFNEFYPKLGPMLTVISDNHNGSSEQTTTYEGIVALFESLLKIQTQYEVIIVDYFQNISSSLEHPSMEEWKVLDKVAQFLDGFRKRYNAPIVLLSQLKPGGEDPAPFKERIERCKSIYNKSTCVLEMKADVKNSTTVFTVHKSRFTSSIGKNITVGFQRGKYVKNDANFINRIHQEKLEQMKTNEQKEMLSNIMKT
jgi:replicative DNA helicase